MKLSAQMEPRRNDLKEYCWPLHKKSLISFDSAVYTVLQLSSMLTLQKRKKKELHKKKGSDEDKNYLSRIAVCLGKAVYVHTSRWEKEQKTISKKKSQATFAKHQKERNSK